MITLDGVVISPHPAAARSQIAHVLDQLAFAALMLLGVTFAAEFREPAIRAPGWFVLSNIEVLILALLVLWIAAKAARRQIYIPAKKIGVPLALWVGWLALSALAAPVHGASALHFLGRVTAGIFVGWAALDLADTPQRQKLILMALALGGILVAVQGLLEATGSEPILRWLSNFKVAQTHVGDVIRISSTLSYATITAMVLEMAIPILIALWVGVKRTSVSILLGMGTAASLVALVMTLSRGGLIALFIVLCAGMIYGLRTGERRLWLSAGISVVLLLTFGVLTIVWNPTVGLRLSTETEQTWYRAQYMAPDQVEAKPGEVVLVPIRVTNTSVRRWGAGGDQPFMLGYHLVDSAGATVTYDGARTRLPHDLAPGEELVLNAEIRVPELTETYTIQWDMVQEAVSWFSWKGTPIAETMLVVRGEPVKAATIPQLPAPTDLSITRPTAERRELWLAALQMTADRPILGVGPDNFRWRYGDYAGLASWNTDIHANNLYLEWLADTGVPGLLLFLWASWTIIRTASRGLRISANPVVAVFRLGLLGSLMAWYLHGMVDYFYEFTPTFVAFWMIAGLSLRMAEEET